VTGIHVPFVQHDASSQVFVICIDLFTELVHKLVKAEIDFCFNLIVQELLLEHGEGIVGTVIVQVQGVENTPVGGILLNDQNMTC
jgi:hypothetical protein